MSDLIDRQSVLKAIDEYERLSMVSQTVRNMTSLREIVQQLPAVQTCEDAVSRQAAIKAINSHFGFNIEEEYGSAVQEVINGLPSAQPEQRYTEEELRVFAHGISLSLLSKRSAQHWQYDEDTATEIKFLERLYDKVVADMGDEQDE